MSPARITYLPDWPAIRERCARGEWQGALSAAGPCPGKDGAGYAAWRAAYDYIETEKAARLAALTAAWRERSKSR